MKRIWKRKWFWPLVVILVAVVIVRLMLVIWVRIRRWPGWAARSALRAFAGGNKPKEKLKLLQRLDRYRDWNSTHERRLCLGCGRSSAASRSN